MEVKNNNLQKARSGKDDEFYTQLTDIENELKHYKLHFKDKVVFCNCDDPEESNFWCYFGMNFYHLGLRRLITTHYVRGEKSYSLEMNRGDSYDLFIKDPKRRKPLSGDGDFRSEECLELLKQSDIVVTNPPFSLFREYISQLVEYNKRFLIIGNNNAITYKDVFSHIRDNRIWLGVSPRSMSFKRIDGSTAQVNANWFTNLEHRKRNERLELYMRYFDNPSHYPKYDNYDAIEVSKTKEIPEDFDGLMGVPITFLDKYNPDQFEILGLDDHREWRGAGQFINGKKVYRRVIIRKKK